MPRAQAVPGWAMQQRQARQGTGSGSRGPSGRKQGQDTLRGEICPPAVATQEQVRAKEKCTVFFPVMTPVV